MKTRFKKLLALALVLMMVLSAMPVSAAAEVGAELIKSAPSVMDKVWSGWRNAWPGQLAGKIAGRPAQKLHNEAIDGALISVDAPNLALPEGTTVEVEKITDMETIQSIIDNTPGIEAKAVNAYDITFRHNGEEVEPLYDVDVVLNASGIVEGKTVSLYHIDASAAELNSEMTCEKVENAEVSGSTVSFRANAFSIYFVGTESSADTIEVRFYEENDLKSSQYVVAADFADGKTPIYEPAMSNSQGTFSGWLLDNSGEPMLITDINDYVRDNFQVIHAVGGAVVSFYATEVDIFYIVYMDGDGTTDRDNDGVNDEPCMLSRMPYILDDDGCIDFVVNNTFTSPNGYLDKWEGSDGLEYTPGSQVEDFNTADIDGNELVLYPVFKSGHWVVFDTNEAVNDANNGFTAAYPETSKAKLIAPIFVPEGKTLQQAINAGEAEMPTVFVPVNPRSAEDYYLEPGSVAYDSYDVYRRGYDFGGWYTDAAMTTAFNPNQTLTGDITVYAKWEPGLSTVRVIVYKERTDSPRFTNSSAEPTYDYFAMLISGFYISYTLPGGSPASGDASPWRDYVEGAAIATGASYGDTPTSIKKEDINYFRSHDGEDYGGHNKYYDPFFDWEFEYFYFDDSRGANAMLYDNPTIPAVRGDGTSTIEFYLRRAVYNVKFYNDNTTNYRSGSYSYDSSYVYFGKRNSNSSWSSLDPVVYDSGTGKYYFKKEYQNGEKIQCTNSNVRGYKANKALWDYGVNYVTLGTLLYEYNGPYYGDFAYPDLPDGQLWIQTWTSRRDMWSTHSAKTANYNSSVYDSSLLNRTGGYAKIRYSPLVLTLDDITRCARDVRVLESEEFGGKYTYFDNAMGHTGEKRVWIYNNIDGFFPNYLEYWEAIGNVTTMDTYWKQVVNKSLGLTGTQSGTLKRRVYMSDLDPDGLRALLGVSYTNITELFVAYLNSDYRNDPLWRGPRAQFSSWSEGAYVVDYNNSGTAVSSVVWKTNDDMQNEYGITRIHSNYKDNQQTVVNNLVCIYHYARKVYPLTYMTPDSALFGLEANDSWVAYGLSPMTENRLRPSETCTWKAKAYYAPEGKYFVGWYDNYDLEHANPFNENEPFGHSGREAVAKFAPIKYRVVLHYGNDEYPEMEFSGTPTGTILVEHGDYLPASLENAATLDGYTLTGWKIGNEPFNFDSTKISDAVADMDYCNTPKTGVDDFGNDWNDYSDESVWGIVHIYAQWAPDNFNEKGVRVIYDAVDGKGYFDIVAGDKIVIDPESHLYPQESISYGRPATTAEENGSHFLYWELHKRDGSILRVYPGQKFEVNEANSTSGLPMTWNYKDAFGVDKTETNTCFFSQHPTAPSGVPTGYVNSGTYYKFVGWKINGESNIVDLSEIVPQNSISFTAVYEAQSSVPQVTITFDTQPEGMTGTTTVLDFGETYSIPAVANSASNPNYFIGWSTTPNGEVVYEAGDTYVMTDENETALNLYAVNAHTVVYRDGYTGSTNADIITYVNGTSLTLPALADVADWTHSGYAFSKWQYNGNEYNPNYTLNNLSFPAVITANWINGHIVTYDANGGSGSYEQSVPLSDSFIVLNQETANNMFTRVGYELKGFSTDPNATTNIDHPFGANKGTLGANVTIYAVWEQIHYTITYNGNGGGSSMESSNTTRTYGQTYELLSCGYSAPDLSHQFIGWKIGNTGELLAENTQLTITANIEVYAQWGLKQHHITFNGNGYTGGTMPTDIYRNNEQYQLPTCEFTKTDYEFVGWKVNNSGDTYSAGAYINITDSIVLYAQWEEDGFKPMTGTTFSDSKIYLIGCVSGSYIYLMSSDAYNTSYRALVKQAYDGIKLKTTDSRVIWKISSSASALNIKSTAVNQWLYYQGGAPTLSSSSYDWYLSSKKIYHTNSMKYGLTFNLLSNSGYVNVGSSPSTIVILEKNAPSANGNILPAPASRQAAAVKAEKAVDVVAPAVVAPAVDTKKAAPEIANREGEGEPEYVVYLTAVYGRFDPDVEDGTITFNANGLSYCGGTDSALSKIQIANQAVASENVGEAAFEESIIQVDLVTNNQYIRSSRIKYTNGEAYVYVPGPDVFEQNGQAGYRIIGWNTEPDGSGMDILFSGISGTPAYDGTTFDTTGNTVSNDGFLKVYIDNNDKAMNTRINTLYAMWEGYTAFYHSSNNTIESNCNSSKVKYSGNTVGGTLVYSTYAGVDTTVNIPELVPAGSLYGGYYKDYARKGSYSTFAVTDGVTDAVAYNGANANWYMDDENTGAYKERGDKFSVAKNKVSDYIGKTIYIKEVPASKYLKICTYYTYNKTDKVIRSWWLITDTDDKNYVDTGFIIGEVVTPCQSWPKTVRIAPKNGADDPETGAKTISQNTFSTDRAWVPYKGYREDSDNTGSFEALENKTYTNYWITPDSILVIGTRQRTFGSDISNTKTISNNMSTDNYTGVKYYYTEIVND